MKSRAGLVLLVIFGLHQKICGQFQSGQRQIPYPYYTQPIPSVNHGAPTFPYFQPQPYFGMNPIYTAPQNTYYSPMPYPYSNLPYPYSPYPYPIQQQPYYIPQVLNNQKNSTKNTENSNQDLTLLSNNPVYPNAPSHLPKALETNKDDRNSYIPEEVYEEYDFDGKLISAQTEFKPPVWIKNEPRVTQYSFPQPFLNNSSNDFSRNSETENKKLKIQPYVWYGKNTTIYKPEPIKGISVMNGTSTTTIIANTVIKPNQKPVTTVQIFRDQNQNRPNVTVVNPEKNEVFFDTGLTSTNNLHSTNYNSFTTTKPTTTMKPSLAYGNGYSPTRWTTTSVPWYLRQTPTISTTTESTTPLHLPLIQNNYEDNEEDDHSEETHKNLIATPETSTSAPRQFFSFF